MAAPDALLQGLDEATVDLLSALALGATPRWARWVQELLEDPALWRGGAKPDRVAVSSLLHRAARDGLVEEMPRRPGCWALALPLAAPIYRQLLQRVPREPLRLALARVDQYPPLPLAQQGWWRFPSGEAAVARLRLELFCGASPAAIAPLLRRLPYGMEDEDALYDATITQILDETLFSQLHPDWQGRELEKALRRAGTGFSTGVDIAPGRVRVLAAQHLQAAITTDSWPLREALAEYLLQAAPFAARDAAWADGIHGLLRAPLTPAVLAGAPEDAAWRPPADPDEGAAAGRDEALRAAQAQAFEAATLALQARWPEAQAAFDVALAALRKARGRRKGVLRPALVLPLAMAWMGQGGTAALDPLIKHAQTETGKREPPADQPLGLVALAAQMRLGERPRDAVPFRPFEAGWRGAAASPSAVVPLSPLDLPRWLMRAWLKDGAEAEPLSASERASVERLAQALDNAGLGALREWLDAALDVLAGKTPPAGFFIAGAPEPWQAALAALQSVAGPTGAAPVAVAAANAETRTVWLVERGPHGAIAGIVPHEQKRGARGWGVRKEVPLLRLQRQAAALPPADSALAHAIKTSTLRRQPQLDLAAAAAALVGHPCVAMVEAPDQLVEIVAGAPELEIIDEGERLRVRLQPPLRVTRDEQQARWAGSEAELKALDALRGISLWPQGATQARLIQLSPAQRRVAQLLGEQGLEVPRKGLAQLQEVLAGLGSHFRIQADEAAATTPTATVEAESRLRAELQPLGQGLQLRLQAAPFGEAHAADGPRLIPGRGRAHLVATLGGTALGTERRLADERAHLEAVLDACPMLPELAPEAPCEWWIEQPDDALALLERLHAHTGIAALDWPQGKPVRVVPGQVSQMTLHIRSRQDWLALSGELRVDEELVMSLQQLIAFAAGSRSRFVPLGDGRFIALTQTLRERIDDLAAVTEARAAKGDTLADLRVPAIAAPWLQQATEGAQVQADDAFTARLQALEAAQRLVPRIPDTLQATLRPYQEEGVEWALRLSHAGLGACLADDMGLGKTLQALAVLLARAGSGPALVVAPTSLLGNWRAEARRFAPTLRVHVYAEGGPVGERASALAGRGPGDLVLVSYPMLMNDAEAFAGLRWGTLVLDEAQAIKNANARRSQAVFGLQAGFRLALSGTPIENRLAELWSIMEAVNPGLLGTAARFNERFGALIERQRDRVAQRTLRRLIAPFILRRTKAQVLDDLPPRTELILPVRLGEAERAHYEALRRDALVAAQKALSGNAPGQAQMNILAGLTRLRRAACDPRLVSPELKIAGAKVQAFGELAAELVANGHKALVFSQFVDFLALLRAPLDEAGIAYQYLDGSTPAAERTKRVDAFQAGEGHLFLISLKAGGFGLNLTAADFVVIADPWWNPAAEDQATGRAHRIGQARPVTVYRIVAEDTLEDRILTLHQTKRELADGVLEGGEGHALPNAEELVALMAGADAEPEAPEGGRQR